MSNTYPTGKVKVNALEDVDLAICAGEFIVRLVPSGSGRSTLLNILGICTESDDKSGDADLPESLKSRGN